MSNDSIVMNIRWMIENFSVENRLKKFDELTEKCIRVEELIEENTTTRPTDNDDLHDTSGTSDVRSTTQSRLVVEE